MKEITFTNIINFSELEKPQPASKFIPDWYKNMESYIGGIKKPAGPDGKTLSTIKKCLPVFDAITAGYIITLPADVYVSIKNYDPTDAKTGKVIEELPTKKIQTFEWANFGLVEFHPVVQAPEHPLKNEHAYPKWMNPWAIKTPKGYSTLFVQPFHRSSVFTILPGVVDTDTYSATVNFPFVINDPNFEGMIPKGTPIAQCIPIKRNSWKSKLGSKKDRNKIINIIIKLETQFFDRYKTMFWNRKEYR